MTDRHDFTVIFRMSGNFKTVGQRSGLSHERMVAGGLERTGNFSKHSSTVMHNHRSLPVHQLLCPRDAAAIRLSNTLVAETNTEDGDSGTIFAN